MMKTESFFYRLAVLFISVFTFVSCDNNDDEQTSIVAPTDGFTINSAFNETANAYFEIDEDDDDPQVGGNGFPDSYSFFFTNGRMLDNDANVNGSSGDYLFSLDTTEWVFLNVEAIDNPSLVTGGPLAGNTYIVSSTNDSVILEGAQIDALTTPYLVDNIEYGMGNDNAGVTHEPGVQGPTITINAINLDINNPTASTIDADYTFMNQDGVVISGHYEGTFGVILD